MDYYDIDKIIKYAEGHQGLLAANDRQEWVKLCWCLKVLNYPLSSFVAISWATDKECAQVWKAERAPGRYIKSKEEAAAAIVGMAKAANINLEGFKKEADPMEVRPTQTDPNRPNRPNRPKPTALEDFADIPTQALEEGPVEYVPDDVLRGMEAAAERSNLCNYLCRLFPRAEVLKVLQRYRVGALQTNNGFNGLSTIYPLINAQGQIVDLRILPYLENGHRAKGEGIKYPVGSWMAMQHKKEHRGEWCLFGGHLEAPGAVGIVESEKTALLAALALPGTTWMATTSLSNLTPTRLQALKGHECKVFPDADGVDKWRAKVEALRAEGFNISFCSDYILTHAAPGSKEDLGDIIERTRKEVNNG